MLACKSNSFLAGRGGGGCSGRRIHGCEKEVGEDSAASPKRTRKAGKDSGDMSHITCYTCFGGFKGFPFLFIHLFSCLEIGHRSYNCPKKPKKEKK